MGGLRLVGCSNEKNVSEKVGLAETMSRKARRRWQEIEDIEDLSWYLMLVVVIGRVGV